MFVNDITSDIIAFINDVLKLKKQDECKLLLNEAIIELKNREPLMASIYSI